MDLFPEAQARLEALQARIQKARMKGDGDGDGVAGEKNGKRGAPKGKAAAAPGKGAKPAGTPIGPQAVAAAVRLGLKTEGGVTFRTFTGPDASSEAMASKARFTGEGSGFKLAGTRWNATRARSEYDLDHEDGSPVTLIVSERSPKGAAAPVAQVVLIPRVEPPAEPGKGPKKPAR